MPAARWRANRFNQGSYRPILPLLTQPIGGYVNSGDVRYILRNCGRVSEVRPRYGVKVVRPIATCMLPFADCPIAASGFAVIG